jgi:thioredoxin-related protein
MARCLFALLAAVWLPLSIAPSQDRPAQEGPWLQDFAAARTKAMADHKDLLIDFTGSDWCTWCQRLDREVFATSEFLKGVAKDFVLLKLDYPHDVSLVAEAIRKQNEGLQREWGIDAFPSVFLADADGRPYAQTGYQPGGAAQYLEHLATLRETKAARDEPFAQAKDKRGVERARLLARGLDALGGAEADAMRVDHYRGEITEILALDPKNEAQLKERFTAMLARIEEKRLLDEVREKFGAFAAQEKWSDAAAAMDVYLSTHRGRRPVEQMATYCKAIAAIEGRKDYDAALQLLAEAKAFAPDSELGKEVDRIRKNVEGMRDAAKAGANGGAKKEGGG